MDASFRKSRLNTTCFSIHNAKKKQKLKVTNAKISHKQAKTLNRIQKLSKAAQKQGCNNFIAFNDTNLIYLTGFSGAIALLIPEDGNSILYVSAVNYEQAKAEVKDATVQLLQRSEDLMERIVKQASGQDFAVDSTSIETWRALAKVVGGEEKLHPANNLVQELRKVKDRQEIQLIREACKLADIGIEAASKNIRPGVKEKLVAAEAEYAMRKEGSDGTAFETIVASGHCCAYPHGTFMEKIILEGDLVVVDLGATQKFYRSDITRTFIVGKSTEKQKRILEIVKSAHQNALDTIKPRVPAKDVDMAARRVIEEAGFGEFFVHNLGHGVGLEVHEAPTLSPESKEVLNEGNVLTVEPGIYLPGFGGVRIEDTILVTRDGAEKLTYAPYLF
jgi:Xaa-Pro dipeptidase